MNAATAPQFIVVPLTGMQICRRLPLNHIEGLSQADRDALWKSAKALGDKPVVKNAMLPIVANHIACDQNMDASGWIACSPGEAIFFRLVRIESAWAVDLVIDTQNGAGKMPYNRVDCVIETGMVFMKKKFHLATFYVEQNSQPRNVAGSLIVDYGNTGTSFIFSPDGVPPSQARPIHLHNPFDPLDSDEKRRPRGERTILRSTTFLLRVPESDVGDPWLVLGQRAEELIATQDALTTSLYAPKKYVRVWPTHLKSHEPTVTYRGLQGQRSGLIEALHFVEKGLEHMLQTVLSSLANPKFASPAPDVYPQVSQVLLTYPLTWREADRALFKKMVKDAADKLFVLDERVREHFKVELVCSEPVAVAAYALWETFFRYFYFGARGENLRAPSLASSSFGNTEGGQQLRILVVDIGGGSTDIALVEADWEPQTGGANDDSVEVSFKLLESLRFNRAGDRVSHIMATAILEFLKGKFGVAEGLDFRAPASAPSFTLQKKRQAVSTITALVEQAKHALAAGRSWELHADDEAYLAELLAPVIDPGHMDAARQKQQMEITLGVLRRWLEADRRTAQTRGEPGFMDIFYYLEEMSATLAEQKRSPHLVILSGRATRLPFIKDMTARAVKLPFHRIRTLGELLPDSLKNPDHRNMDKLSVVYGAHRFRFGSPVNFRFQSGSESDVFHRFVGTVSETPHGMRMNKLLVSPGEVQPRTCKLKVPKRGMVRLGQAFRSNGMVEILAALHNSTADDREVEIDLRGDYSVELKRSPQSEGVFLTEWVPGGTSDIVDNFNDTGRIDGEPDGFIRNIVMANQEEWIKG
ncbi:MAG: hypothetical protein EXS09_20805 [Gemmataceae bacterium]|nr:hypothetical protein [Gemmataceae bacterium]